MTYGLRQSLSVTLPSVAEADMSLQSPFTQPLSASMMEMKEEQTKMKANPPGTSKILARARKKAMEEQEKKVLRGRLLKTRYLCRPGWFDLVDDLKNQWFDLIDLA